MNLPNGRRIKCFSICFGFYLHAVIDIACSIKSLINVDTILSFSRDDYIIAMAWIYLHTHLFIVIGAPHMRSNALCNHHLRYWSRSILCIRFISFRISYQPNPLWSFESAINDKYKYANDIYSLARICSIVLRFAFCQ